MPAFQFWRKLEKKNEGYNVIWSGWQYQKLQVPLRFCSLTYNTSVKAINMYRYSFLNSLQQAKTSKSYVSKRQVRAVACKANNILLPTCGVGIHISHPSASIIPAHPGQGTPEQQLLHIFVGKQTGEPDVLMESVKSWNRGVRRSSQSLSSALKLSHLPRWWFTLTYWGRGKIDGDGQKNILERARNLIVSYSSKCKGS